MTGNLTRFAIRRLNRNFPVANIKSQIKRNKQNEGRRLRNKAAKSEIKTRVKNALRSASEAPSPEEAEADLRLAVKRLDKAVSRGIIHKNQAANRKSSLMRQVNALTAESGSAEG
jgi:small subunit ribosomal protein S20